MFLERGSELWRNLVSPYSPSLVQGRNVSWFVLSLVCIWGALFALTWAHWGDLTVDCGREMYVASELAHGKTLYSDLWYPYTPGGPYLNSVLFRLFGFRLEVLYWAGALAALGSAVFLFLTSLHFVSRMAAWTTAVVLLIQSFVPRLFSFPLPYSFGAAYGCFSACVFLWLIVNACSSRRAGWMMVAGIVASIALLMKQEIGGACFAALALLVIIRGMKQRSFQRVSIDVAILLPGGLLCIGVIYWMISLRGAEFLAQENLMSWPTSYFMRNYGALWLSLNGSAITSLVVFKGVAQLSILIVFWLGIRWVLIRYKHPEWLSWAGLLALAGLLLVSAPDGLLARRAHLLFFPPATPLLVTIMLPIAGWLSWREHFEDRSVQILMLFFLTSCVSIRILARMEPSGYAIYYNGPAVLSYFLILSWLLGWKASGLTRRRSVAFVPCIAALLVVSLDLLPLYKLNLSSEGLITDRGVIYTTPQKAQAYRSVLDFIQHQASMSFLSVPEDASLYFFAGVRCPTRFYAFTPGVLAPGAMTRRVIREIEQKKVRYLIWSNRTFEEYGTPNFGVDFDQELGEYFATTYRPTHVIGDKARGGWKAVVWEKKVGTQYDTTPTSTATSPSLPIAR